MKRINIRIILIAILTFILSLQGQTALSSGQTPDPETILQHEAAQRMRQEQGLFSVQATTIKPIWPCYGEITSLYGWRVHPIYGDWRFHYGLDIGVDSGTLIVAPLSGIISDVSWSDAVGNVVEINHGNGVYTRFCHLLASLVYEGQAVTQGQNVALSDNTGYLTTGAHLHFEVYDFNDPANVDGTIDPLIWLSSYPPSSIVNGDFDNDSNADVALLYDYGNENSRIRMLKSNGTGMTANIAWESGPGNFDSSRAKVTSGDYDGDGTSDVAMLYDYGGANTGVIFFNSNGTNFAPRLAWSSGPGNWDWSRSQVVSGDYNNDNLDDLLILYNYGNANTAAIVMQSNGTTFTPRLAWSSGPGNWDWSRTKLIAGDFNADNRDDIMTLYDYGNANTGAIVLESNGANFTPHLAWSSGPGNWDWSRVKIAAGSFNGDSFDDIAALYDYGNANTAAIVMQSNGTTFTTRQFWASGPGNWDWARTKITAGDFNADGNSDIIAFYSYDGGNAAAIVLRSNGAGFTPQMVWSYAPGG